MSTVFNTFVRSWAAVPSMDSNGEPNGGVVGFIRSLKFVMRDVRPDRVIVVWDGEGGSMKRRSVYKDYKAGRKPRINRQYDFETPEQSMVNLKVQYAKLRQVLPLLGVLQVELPDVEADDVVAFICRQLRDESQKVILSSDKDFWQLLDPRTIVYSPSKKKYYTKDDLREELGVLAENYIYVKAMVGDGSDNIKGLKGIGVKTAAKLFPFLSERPTTLDEIVAHAEANREKSPRYKAVADERETLSTNLQLMQLTSPIISAQAGRIIRTAIEVDPSFNLSEMRIVMLRDGIQVVDGDLFSVFESYKMRAQGTEARTNG